MDIGYSDGASYGGRKYVLILVDQCTMFFLYMVCKDLWVPMCLKHYGNFSLMLGAFPDTIQFNFDPRLVGGKATALLCTHVTRICAAPPHRQDKNCFVERRWQSLTRCTISNHKDLCPVTHQNKHIVTSNIIILKDGI